jgi:hypothetical protein
MDWSIEMYVPENIAKLARVVAHLRWQLVPHCQIAAYNWHLFHHDHRAQIHRVLRLSKESLVDL